VEILIYGEIGSEVRSKEVNEAIRKSEGKLTLRINSYGCDVFHAVAIHNAIKDRGNVEVRIDGICASAATIIALGANRILMPENARFMIHEPSTLLVGYYDLQRIERIKRGLESVQNSILGMYREKTNLEDEKIQKLIEEETWMSAEEAKNLGFIDEIIEPVEDVQASIAQKAVMAERERVRKLESVETSSIAAKAIIAVAKSEGKTLEEITPYLDAIGKSEASQSKEEKRNPSKSQEFIERLADYLDSGASNIGNAPLEENDVKKQAISNVVKWANEGRK